MQVVSGFITPGGEGLYVFLIIYVSFYRKAFFRHNSFFQITYKFSLKPKNPAQKETELIITRSGDEDVA